jgi:fibronectin-binding autotransporter adhesin
MKPKNANRFLLNLRHRALVPAVVVSLSALAAHSAIAANQTYQDANILNTWNTTDANWDAGVVWTNANSAIFAGTGETVTVTAVTPNAINFNSSGYTLTGGTITLGATTTPIALTANATIASTIAGGTNGLTKSGAGTLTLSGPQTYTGSFILSGGGNAVFASGTTFSSNTSISLTGVSTTSRLTIESGSTITTKYFGLGDSGGSQSGRVDQTGGAVTVNVAGNNFRVGHWDNSASPGSVYNLSGGTLDTRLCTATVSHDGTADVNVGGGAGTATWQAAAINFDAGGADTKVGKITLLSNGLLEVNGAVGASNSGAALEGIHLAGGTIKTVTSSTTNATLYADSNSTIDANGLTYTLTGGITGSSTINLSAATGTVSFSTTGNQSIAAPLSGTTAITKVGTGTTTFSGTSTHTGTLAVNAGRLNLTGSIASTTTTVASGATLSGEGSVGGTVTPAAGSTLSVDPNTAGAITFSNLNLTGQPNVAFTTVPSNAQSPVRLFTYTGTLTSPNGLLTDLKGLSSYADPVVSDVAGVVTFSFTSQNLVWSGPGNVWDLKTTANWATSQTFASGATALFDDTPGVPTAITLAGILSPSTFTVNSSTNNFTITGSVGNYIAGTTSLVKSGTSTLTLSAPNTFTGGVVVNGGTLKIGNLTALGAYVTGRPVTQVVVNSGGAIDFNGVADATYGYTISGTGVLGAGALLNTGGGIGNGSAQTSNIKLAANASIGGTGNWALLTNGFGATSLDLGGFTLSKTGTNTIHLCNTTTTAGAISVESGTLATVQTASNAANASLTLANTAGVNLSLGVGLSLGSLSGGGTTGGNVALGANTLTVGALNASANFAGTISGTGAITKNGTGIQALSGTNTYTGINTISAGTLQFGKPTSLYNNTTASWTPANIRVASGATVAFNVGGTGEFATTDVTTLLTNLSTIVSNGLQAGSAVGFDTTNAAGGTFTLSNIITNSTGTGSGAVGVTKLGTGTLVLSGASTYTGTTNVLGGILQVDANNGGKTYTIAPAGTLNLGYSTGDSVYGYTINVNGAGTAATTGAYLKGGNTYTIQGGLNLNTAPTTIRGYGTGSATLAGWDSNGTHLTVSAAASGSVTDSNVNFKPGGYGYVMNIAAGANTATGDITFQGPLTGAINGNGTVFRKIGVGSLVLAGAGSNSAPVDIRAGSVILSGGDNRIGSGSSVILGNGTGSGKLILNGTSQTLTAISSVGTGTTNSIVGGSATASALTLTSSGTFPSSGTTATLGGVGTNENNFSLAKSGSGTFTLNGTNTYTGGTTVNGGTLSLGSAGAVGTSGTITLNGGTLQFSAGNTTDYTASGRLKLEDNLVSTIDTNGVDVTFTGSFVLGTNSTAGLGKSGAGTLTLSAPQTFDGGTSVSGGVLALDYSSSDTSRLSDNSQLTLAGGTIRLIGGSHQEWVFNTLVTGNSTIERSSGTAKIDLGDIVRSGSFTLSIAEDNIARTSLGNDISGKLPSWITVNGSPASNDGSGNIVAYAGFVNVFRLGGQIANNAAANVKIVDGGTSGPVTPLTTGLTDISSLIQNASAGSTVVTLGASDILRFGETGAISVQLGSGDLTLQGGTLTAGGADDTLGDLSVDASANVVISSAITDNGAGQVSLAKLGTATLTLSGTNTYTGGTVLNAGELHIDNASALGVGPLVINGGSLDNTSGAPIVVTNLTPQTWNTNISFLGSNDLTFASGNVGIGASRTVTVEGGQLTIGGSINNNASGTFTLTKLGSGVLSVGGGNWSGLTTVTEGTLEVLTKTTDVAYVVGSGATLKLAYTTGGGYANTNLKITGNGTSAESGLSLKGGASYNGSGTIQLLSAPTTIRQYGTGLASIGTFDVNGDALTTVSAASGSVIDANIEFVQRGYGMSVNIASGSANATGDLVMNGPLNVIGGNSLGFYKRGAGSILLNAAATANTALQLQGGSVICGIANCLGTDTTNLLLSSGTTLKLNGFSQTAGSLSGAGKVVNGSSTAAVLSIKQASDVTFTGPLGGIGTDENNFSLVKTGTFKLTLGGTNTYTGSTTVNAGTLSIGSAFLANSSDVLITTGATLELTTGTTDTIDELIVDGTPQAPGVYGAIGSGAQFEKDYITGTGTLTVTTGPAGFSSWIGGFGLAVADQDAGDDPDFDGIPNAIEFVLGGNPATVVDTALLPTIELVTTDLGAGSTDYLKFTFRRTDASVIHNPAAQYDTDLAGTWTTAVNGTDGIVVQSSNDFYAPAPNGIDQVIYYIPRSLAAPGTSLFGRLNVTIP